MTPIDYVLAGTALAITMALVIIIFVVVFDRDEPEDWS